MARRSTPQSKIDEAAFPIRVKVKVPGIGLGRLHDDIIAWLRAELAPGDYASHGSSGWGIIGHVAAYYFRTIYDAARFIAAFPDLELADGVAATGYNSPAKAARLT